MMQRILKKLPRRFKWSIHNIVGHPLMEVCNWYGLYTLAEKIHDKTLPGESSNL